MSSFRKTTGKGGKVTLHYRWSAPFREEGQIVYRDIERSTGTGDIALARKKAKLFEQEAIETANRVEAPKKLDITFAEAALLYMQSGHSNERMQALLKGFGSRLVSEINQDVVLEYCREQHPGVKASTLNRSVFTPLLAVINFAAKLKKCTAVTLIRPAGHDKSPPLNIPDEQWFDAVLPHLDPDTRAVALIVTLHGRRISEIVERTPSDLDTKRWTLEIPDTKTGKPVLVRLSAPVVEAIKAMPEYKSRRWLFGTRYSATIRDRVRRVCDALKLPYYGTHAFGRHSFATRLLAAGKSVKFVQEAGGWANERMVCGRYGHLEKSEVADGVAEVAKVWASGRHGKMMGSAEQTRQTT